MASTPRRLEACPSCRALPQRPPAVCRRSHRRLAAAASDESNSAAQAQVLKQVEASASVIDSMVQEIARELFLDATAQDVLEARGSSEQGEAPPEPASAADVVAGVVGRRLDQLDATFLATLDGYIGGAGERGASEVAEVLLMVRDEVLRQLGRQLPPEMQLLEAAVAAPDALAREVLLQRHARLSTDAAATPAGSGVSEGGSGGAGDGDGGASLDCLAADLERAASQVISDMELMPTIPDRRLLAKLVLVREEVQQSLVEAGFLAGGAPEGSPEAAALRAPFRQLAAVPKADAAFVQRLMALAGQPERRALLERALTADTERLADTSRGEPTTNFERLRMEAERPQEWVRPGRFMQCLNAVQAEMLNPTPGSDAPPPSDAALERLETIRRQALEVLLEMAGEGQPYLP